MQAAHRSLQHPYPLFKLFGLINFFGLFHADHLSSAAIAILPDPTLHRLGTLDPILARHRAKRKPARLHLPHHTHFERLAVPNFFPISW
jgi:hypothetical protein